MWSQFFFINTHFALSAIASLIYFLVAWLYLDAWVSRKSLKDALKIMGFVCLSLGSIVHASHIDSTVLQVSFLSSELVVICYFILQTVGLVLILVGLVIDPILDKPNTQESLDKKMPIGFVTIKTALIPMTVVLPILSSIVGFLYLRRATIGYERHLRLVALSFFVLALSNLLGIVSIFYDTSNVQIFKIIAPYSSVWMIEHVSYALSIGLLSIWVFGYLLKRLQSQLFVFFSAFVIVIFVLMTVSFSALILKNLESETLKQIRTDGKVLEFALESKGLENISDAVSLAENPSLIESIVEDEGGYLAQQTETFLVSKKKSSLLVLNENGEVIARGEKPDSIGDSFSEDITVKRALNGQQVSSIQTYEGVVSPILALRSVVPIKDGGKIVGAILCETILDNAFVDKIQNATGLAVSVYAQDVLSATTFMEPDGKSRSNGLLLADNAIVERVLNDGKEYIGTVKLQGVYYYASVNPLRDADNVSVGMILVAQDQVGLLKTAARAMEITFLIALAIEVFSLIPAFFLSRYISRQIQ